MECIVNNFTKFHNISYDSYNFNYGVEGDHTTAYFNSLPVKLPAWESAAAMCNSTGFPLLNKARYLFKLVSNEHHDFYSFERRIK